MSTGDRAWEQRSRTRSKSAAENNRERSDAARYGGPSHSLRRLHRSMGNQAVLGMLQTGRLQAKYTVSSPDDHLEREADRVADEVMRMAETPAFGRQQSAASGGGESLQRKPG